MYTPKQYKLDDQQKILSFIKKYNFASLISTNDNKPFCTHLPFLLNTEQNCLFGHMAAQNPQCDLLVQNQDVLVIFNGPHAYISPEWYTSARKVPTWNYLAIHVYGKLEFITDNNEVEQILKITTEVSEKENGTNWQYDSIPPALKNPLLTGIKAFKIKIESIEAKAKMNQKNTKEDIQGVISGLQERGHSELASLMSEILN